ncbi:MAG: hypothetical protein MRECE_45c010 [Mycoplasmataceae bacterium CE_OT135]|nr:MAG: hypothetical protein MRECE_45c010 [Mycoplasmataceae bacterium CE_OT135]
MNNGSPNLYPLSLALSFLFPRIVLFSFEFPIISH